MSDIVKEAVRAYHRMIGVVEFDQRNRAANLMSPSEIVNTEPNPEQAQTTQTKKVCSVPVIEIIDTDDDVRFITTIAESRQNINTEIEEEIEETRPLAEIRENTVANIEENQANTNGDISGHTMDELNSNQNMQIKNERVKDDPEMPILSFRHVFMSHLTESEPLISSQVSRKQPIRGRTQTSKKYQESSDSDEEDQLKPRRRKRRRYHQEGDNHNNPTKRRQYKTEADFLERELIEIGRCELPYLKNKMKFRSANHEEKQAYESVLKVVYTLLGRLSKFEKPNGGSFYTNREGIRQNVNGDLVNNAVCYGYFKHNCPVKLKFFYERERSVYKLYRTGTHNHELTKNKCRLIENLDDLNIEIISSKIAPETK